MLFLIEYNRREGKLVTMRTFNDVDRKQAFEARFVLESTRDRDGSDHEVVLLEAADERAIRTTHSRYFSTDEELTESAKVEHPAAKLG